MVGKLLKYDLIQEGKLCGLYSLMTIACAMLYRLFGLGQDTVFSIVQKFLLVLLVVLIIGSVIVPVAAGWMHYIKNVYKDEGYLTNTLPVTKGAIFWSEWLSAMICLFVCLACAALSLWLVVYFEDPEWARMTLSMFEQELQIGSLSHLLVVFALAYYAQVAFVMTCGMAGITSGQYFDKDKTAKSVLFGILYYIAGILLILGITFLIAKIDPGFGAFLDSDTIPDKTFVMTFLLFVCTAYIVCMLVMGLISTKIMNKGMELE